LKSRTGSGSLRVLGMRADAKRSARWQRLDYQDESRLLSLAESTGDLGDLTLDVMTHLPLRIASWRTIRSRLENRLLVAETSERRHYLEGVLQWVPRVKPQDVSADVSALPPTGPNQRVRSDLDIRWMKAHAPGCVLLSDVELTRAAARAKRQLPELHQLAKALLSVNPWSSDRRKTSSIGKLDPNTVTALFGLLRAEEYWIVNSLVVQIAANSRFRPDIRGLFRVYWRTLANYAKKTKRPLDSRLLVDRDYDDDALCWRASQIAWCVSRGGISHVVEGLRIELGSSDLKERTAAVALIADAADYSVQRGPALFGGGAAPPRLAPNNPFLVVSEAVSGFEPVDIYEERRGGDAAPGGSPVCSAGPITLGDSFSGPKRESPFEVLGRTRREDSAGADTGGPAECERYTDLTLYEEHLYASDDLATATTVAAETPLVAGRLYTLEVAIRLKRTGIDASRSAPRAVTNPREDAEDLTVYILAESYSAVLEIPEPFRRITWPYDADSDSALFRLIVQTSNQAECTIDVRLYDGALDLLDRVALSVTVVPRHEQILRTPGIPAMHLAWPDTEPGIPHIDPNAPPRQLSVNVRRQRPASSSRLCFEIAASTRPRFQSHARFSSQILNNS